MIIGVVGKIAAGKTTVAEFFEERGFCRVSLADNPVPDPHAVQLQPEFLC